MPIEECRSILDDRHRDTGGQHQGRGTVAEVVRPIAAQPGRLGEFPETTSDPVRAQRLPVLAGEHPPLNQGRFREQSHYTHLLTFLTLIHKEAEPPDADRPHECQPACPRRPVDLQC